MPSRSPNYHGFLGFCGAVVCALGIAASAQAVCIDNAKDLFDTLQAYSTGGVSNGTELGIRLVRGIRYKVGTATGNLPFTFTSTAATGPLNIQGGWNAGCTQQTPLPDTVLDGNGIAQVLNLNNNLNYILLEFVTVQNGVTDSRGGGISINADVQYGGGVILENTVIQNNRSTTYGGGLVVYSARSNDSGSSLYILAQSNLIANNHADLDYGAGYMSGQGGEFPPSFISSTVYGNTTDSSDVGGMSIGDDAQVDANIFSNNTNIGIQMSGTGGSLYYDDYGTLEGTGAGMDTSTSQAPKFIDANGGNFHLSGSSPLIGWNKMCNVDLDLDGHATDLSSPCEPGAYEETIFANGFQQILD